jgi:hypothetical protein
MTEIFTNRLSWLIEHIPPLLNTLSEDDFSDKLNLDKWSKKQILGHLIDSATNNHQRFVRVQFEDVPTITYNSDDWVETSKYQQMNSKHLLLFWTLYNQHLVELIKRIPDDKLLRECNTHSTHTLLWLIEDYIRHLEDHLHQMVNC